MLDDERRAAAADYFKDKAATLDIFAQIAFYVYNEDICTQRSSSGTLNSSVWIMATWKMGAKSGRGVSQQGQLIWAHARPAKGPSPSSPRQ